MTPNQDSLFSSFGGGGPAGGMLSQIWITWRSLDEKYMSIYLKETNKFQPNFFESSWQGIMKILKLAKSMTLNARK
jgi:hypothetical protein